MAPGQALSMTGVVWNAGTIRVGPTSSVESPDGLTLTGSGTLALDQSQVHDPSGSTALSISAGASLTGSGLISKRVYNQGLLACDQNELVLQIDGILSSSGTVRVSHHGTLYVNRPLAINLGGTITSGSGGGTFSALGTLDCSHGGRLVADGGDLGLSAGTVMWSCPGSVDG